MARKTHAQAAHKGAVNSWTRTKRTIKDSNGNVLRTCQSISRARRFMRTGSEDRGQ